MLTLIEKIGGRRARYLCECGTVCLVDVSSVNSGHTRSCGCIRRAITKSRTTTHGHKSDGKRSRTYVVWMNMKARCSNPTNGSFADYGARGIGYCEAWELFDKFLADMGEAPDGMTLERIDNDGNYCKANCRWATRIEQAHNKRNNRLIEYRGQIKTLTEWGRVLDIGRVTLLKRLQRGIPVDIAFSMLKFSQPLAAVPMEPR